VIKKPSIQKAIFKTLAGKKAVSFNFLKNEVENAIKDLNLSKNKPEYAISRSIKNMASDGLVECFQSDCQQYFRLSVEGKKRLNNNALDNDTGLISNEWDGYWRMIILDLPEERKSERERSQGRSRFVPGKSFDRQIQQINCQRAGKSA